MTHYQHMLGVQKKKLSLALFNLISQFKFISQYEKKNIFQTISNLNY